MRILKFGGTSVGTPESISAVKDIISNLLKKEEKVIIVVSAFGGTTNLLQEMGSVAATADESYKDTLAAIEKRHFETIQKLFPLQSQSKVLAQTKILLNELAELLQGIFLLKELSARTTDYLLSFGERLSAMIVSAYMAASGIDSKVADTRTFIQTNEQFGKAKVNFETTDQQIKDYFVKEAQLFVTTGFIASTKDGTTSTLGRGGSDYTASIVGAALDVETIEIWTDVDGVMTADPRMVSDAFSIEALSYEEAMEISHFGAKIIYPPSLQPAFAKDIPLLIKNTFNPAFPGTLISKESGEKEYLIKGVSSIKEIALISISGSGMVGVPGFSSRLFGSLAGNGINIILITQASSEHSICFAVSPADLEQAGQILNYEFRSELQSGKISQILLEDHYSILAIIGGNMRNTPGISGTLFSSLGQNGINVSAIAQGSSELNTSVVIQRKDLSKALKALHEAFFLSEITSLNVYLIGIGLIGKTLLQQIKDQHAYLLKEKLLNITVIGISNSKKMYFDTAGISLEGYLEHIVNDGQPKSLSKFVEEIKSQNLPNSIVVDCTSSQEVIQFYKSILSSAVSLVTPNKLANSSNQFETYLDLKRTAARNGVKYLYETNVGAGLPVITTLNDLIYSGDQILKIQGILSGTLSYIFNTFDGTSPFSEVVKQAKEKGYTEPDPRDDLNGMDVARKILILSREAGLKMELSDVQIDPILPDSCFSADSVDAFFIELAKEDQAMGQKVIEANKKGKVMRFIAEMENGKAKIGLKEVDQNHPFYSVSGSDNMISFTTKRYQERPLVIKGPGAGAEVTAAGVFAEIISISSGLVRGRSNNPY